MRLPCDPCPRFVNTYRAAIKVDNPTYFLMSQSESVLKNTIAHYPYEAPEPQVSLRTHNDEVTQSLRRALQERMMPAGILVHSFDLKEISYAPVIASAMLRRQQAT